MKLVKKLLAGAGLAAALAAPSANATLILAFFDGAGNRLGGFTTSLNNNVVNFTGTINGWNVSLASGNVQTINPLDANIGGTASRNCAFGALGCSAGLVGIATGFGPDGPQVIGSTGPTTAATQNTTLKIRLTLLDYPIPAGTTRQLVDALTFSSNPVAPATSLSVFDAGAASGGSGLQNLGTVVFNGTNNLGTVSNVNFGNAPLDPNGLINLTFGFDLTTAALQPSQQGDQFTYANSVRSAIPEPGSLALLGLGLVGLAALRRRKAAA